MRAVILVLRKEGTKLMDDLISAADIHTCCLQSAIRPVHAPFLQNAWVTKMAVPRIEKDKPIRIVGVGVGEHLVDI